MTRYLILGTGVAGISAIEAIRSVDKTGDITLVGDDPYGFYSRPGLAYYLTGELEDKQLFGYPPEVWKELNVRFMRMRATWINPAEHTVQLDNGKLNIFYDKLLIAVGSSAISLAVPGNNLEGVVKLDHMDDARSILNHARKAKAAVIVGGGVTALEIAEGLASRRVKTHYLLRGERYWGNVLDATESRIVENRLKEDGIHIHYQAELAEILGKNGKVSGVRLTSGEVIPCGMVAAAIGIQPRLALATSAGLSVERGILTDESMLTSQPDIYAAGDVAQALDLETGRHVLDSLWTPAREQGRVAGLNMAGKSSVYRMSVPFNVTRLGGLTTTIIGAVGAGRDDDVVGISRGDSETWHEMPGAVIAQGGFDVNHLRLMVGDKHIHGAIVMGDQALSKPLQRIVSEKADISSIRPQLLAPNAPIADILVNFWKSWKTTGVYNARG